MYTLWLDGSPIKNGDLWFSLAMLVITRGYIVFDTFDWVDHLAELLAFKQLRFTMPARLDRL